MVSKKPTKKDLETKIAELEQKIEKLAILLGSENTTTIEDTTKISDTQKPVSKKPKGTLPKGFGNAPPEPKAPEPETHKITPKKPKGTLPKGFGNAPPEPKAPEPETHKITPKKPKGTLPKGFGNAPPEPKAPEPETHKITPKKPKGTLPKGFGNATTPEVKKTELPPSPPKPSETTTPTIQDALENAYYDAPQTDFHQYRAKVTGYSPSPNRYYVRLTAPVGNVPTTDWNNQKAKVTGYTQPSNQYFATRPRLAHHSPDKTFGAFSGVSMTVENALVVEKKVSLKPSKPKGTLPKGF